MDNINFEQTGLLGVIIIITAYFISRYMTTFFERKAQNLADKRDIAEITDKVENIKGQYATTLALLNTNLSLASKGIETFESENFKSYVRFHKACSYILNDVANIDFTALNIKNLDFLKGYNQMVMGSYKRLRLAKASHDLFNDNVEIRKKSFEFFQACVSYISELNILLSKITFLIEGIADYNKQMVEYVINKVSNRPLYDFLEKTSKEYKADLESSLELIKNYVTGENFNKAILIQAQYEELIRKYVRDERKKLLSH